MHSRGLRRSAPALLASLALLWLGAPAAQAQGPTLIKVATYTTPQAPEGVWIDSANNRYVALALTGEIQKISPDGVQSTIATMPLDAFPGTFCFGFPAIIGNAYGDGQGNLFVGVHSCDPADSGLWKVVIATGAMTMVASAPQDALLNGTIVDGTRVLVTDSKYDLVWQAPADGTGQPLTVWKDDPLFKVPLGAPFPGPNGISIFHGAAYVAVSDTALIVKVPILPNGSAGQASVHARLSVGCDDFSFDVLGNIYCTSDPFETVTKISPAGIETVLFTAADGLDGPTSTYFGFGEEGRTLYITNGAFPFFPGTGNGPSLLKVQLDITGYHFPQPDDSQS